MVFKRITEAEYEIFRRGLGTPAWRKTAGYDLGGRVYRGYSCVEWGLFGPKNNKVAVTLLHSRTPTNEATWQEGEEIYGISIGGSNTGIAVQDAVDGPEGFGLSQAAMEAASLALPTLVDPVTFVAAPPAEPDPVIPEPDPIVFGALPTGTPDQSIIPAYPGVDWASNDIHNCWISGEYSSNVENPMYMSGKWQKKWYAAGWGRLLATENYDADWGQWFPNNSYTWFPAPAGAFGFATLGFTKDYIEGLDPVPVRVKVAHWGSYNETNGIAESFGADDRWPPPETIVYEGNGFIPVIPDTGEGHITDAGGNPVNLAAALPAAGGVVCVALECTDLSYEYYRDFAQLHLHLWA